MIQVYYGEHSGETVFFAGKELTAYLERMGISAFHQIDVRGDILLEVWKKSGEESDQGDPYWDDAYEIQIEQGQGWIRGRNSRSVLLGVYRFLREAGCRFLFPGMDGEKIPHAVPEELSVSVQEAAVSRHRGICIEGACALEHVLAMIDWAPKLGYNTYFMQFFDGSAFFERWYDHKGNPLQEAEGLTQEETERFMVCIEDAVQKRGLLYHGVGHGWTCGPLGLDAGGWKEISGEPALWQREYLALIDGKREFFEGIPMNTNLCYGSAATQKLLVDSISAYALGHPKLDVVHFWLADNGNNHCECEKCRDLRPTDAYVRILNQLDERLDELGCSTKIAFLLYFDLLWPPVQEQIQNQDRFLLMFAPIKRKFSEALEASAAVEIPPYRRNQLHFSEDVRENIAFLRNWQKCFTGDSFDYDYHLINPIEFDMGHMVLAEVLFRDIGNLQRLGVRGMVHCQVQRLSIPHNWGGYMAGLALWNPDFDYETELAGYFCAMFGGAGWETALDFCRQASELFPMDYLFRDYHGEWCGYKICGERIRTWLGKCDGFDLYSANWKALDFYRHLLALLNEYLMYQTSAAMPEADAAFERLAAYVWEQEAEFHSRFDAYIFLEYYRRRRG